MSDPGNKCNTQSKYNLLRKHIFLVLTQTESAVEVSKHKVESTEHYYVSYLVKLRAMKKQQHLSYSDYETVQSLDLKGTCISGGKIHKEHSCI